jgi:condensation domain-containing protein/phosphopantetheine binding protein/AMP-binding enzyme
LYIGGEGLARGYRWQSRLTAERFVPNPFAARGGERLYRTGDLARYRQDGSIEYLGRLDHQVKVRGFRIELGEIEAALLEQPGVEAAAMIATKVGSSMQLVAYYVPGSTAPAIADLKEGLSRNLPDYMVPALFVAVPALPLTASGKIDRKELMAWEVSISSEQEYVEPRNEMEAAIAQCWSEILGVRRVGIRDDFFSLGGHSLLAIQVVNKMNLAGCQCSLRDLFDHPTIESIVDHVHSSSGRSGNQPQGLQESYPLLPVQLHSIRLNYDPKKGFSKISPTFIDLIEDVDELALVQALDVWYKQNIFYLRFKLQGDEWRQLYQPTSSYDYCPIHEFNVDDVATDEGLVQKAVEISHRVGATIDIHSGPTLRVVLLRKEGKLRYMIWVMDHLIADNISFFMLFTNLKLAYKQIRSKRAVVFPEDTVIGRWAAYLSDMAHDEQVIREMKFWKSHFPVRCTEAQNVAASEPEQARLQLEHRVQRLDKATSQEALTFLVQQGFSFEEACLGNFLWAFKKCFADDLALLCMISNGRDRQVDGIDLSRGMGWFSLHYPARFQLGTSGGQLEFLHDVVEQHRRYSEIKENYGALRYLNRSTAKELDQVEDWTSTVVFNCMGEVTTSSGEDDVVRLSDTCLKVHVESDRQQRLDQDGVQQHESSPLRRVHFSLSEGAIQVLFSFCPEKVDTLAVDNVLQTVQQSFVGLVRN